MSNDTLPEQTAINSITYRIVYVYAISSTLSDHKFCASQSRTHFVWITNRLCSHIMNSAAFSECNVVISMFFIRRIFSFEFFFRCAFFSHKFVYASVCTAHLRNSKQEKYAVLERRTITSRVLMFVCVCVFFCLFSFVFLRIAFGCQ